MFRGKQALPTPPKAVCSECGHRFVFNLAMQAAVLKLDRLGIEPVGFLCAECAPEDGPKVTH